MGRKILRHPREVQSELNELFKYLFTKPALTILEENKITKEQYVAWASQDFMKQSFWTGIFISIGISGLILWATFAGRQEGKTGFILIGLGFSLFFFLIFLSVAFSIRTSLPNSDFKGNFATNYYAIGLLRKTETKFMKRLSPAKWDRIKKVDVKTWKKRQKPYEFSMKNAALVGRFKSAFKILGVRFTLFFVLILGFILVAPHSFYNESISRLVLLYLLLLTYIGTVLGYSGWMFCYGLIGFIKRDIVAISEFENIRWSGLMATIIGFSTMILAIFMFALFMLIPIAFTIV